jgi:hypothetical protein
MREMFRGTSTMIGGTLMKKGALGSTCCECVAAWVKGAVRERLI